MNPTVQDGATSADDSAPLPGEIPFTLLALTLATGIEQWMGSGFSLVLTDLTGTLSATADEASWAVTVYTFAFFISVALSHRLASFFGNRRLLTFSCVLFAIASLGCAASQSLGAFLFFRLLLGFAGGPFMVRTLVFATQRIPKKQTVRLLGQVYAVGIFSFGRIVAPVAAGWFADNLSWRILFLVNVPVMLLAAWLFHRYAAHHWHADVEDNPPDVPGILLLLAGTAAWQIVLSRGEIDDWFSSPLIFKLSIIAIAALTLLLVWQLLPANRHPLLHLSHIRHRGLFSAVVLGVALGMQLGGSLYVLPQYLRRVETHSALQTGQMLAVGGLSTVCIVAMSPALARLIGLLGSRLVLMIGLAAQMISMCMFANMLTSDTPDRLLWLPLLLNGTFMGFVLPAVALGALGGITADRVSNARAVYYAARQFGATLGITLAVILIDRREAFHSSRLLDSLYSRNLSMLGGIPDPSNVLAMKKMAAAVLRQSTVLTFADVFYAMAALAAVTLFLAPLIPALKSAQPQPTVAQETEPGPALSGGLQATNL
jgi:MFS transporter, DHA2 family, multidrug resistance protein